MDRIKLRKHRKKRIRKKVTGTLKCPRLCVFRSNRATYVQLIDDNSGKVLAQADSRNEKKASSVKSAEIVGKEIGKKALKLKYFSVVFDRGGYKYHGKIKALADAARKEGLKF